MCALSQADRALAHDFVDAVGASLSTDQPHLAIAGLTSWKEIATAVAAGLRSRQLELFNEDQARLPTK